MLKKEIAEHYDKISKHYDRGNIPYDLFNIQFFKFLSSTEMFDYLKSGDSALDIACGTGDLSFGLAKRFQRVYGIDISKEMLKKAKQKTKTAKNRQICFIYGDGEYLPFKDKSFDAVTCMLAIEYFPDTERAISEMKRVLKDEGILLFNLLEMRDGILKKIVEGALQSLRRKFSIEVNSEKLLRILGNAERYERRDFLGHFFRHIFNNTVFVYRKRI